MWPWIFGFLGAVVAFVFLTMGAHRPKDWAEWMLTLVLVWVTALVCGTLWPLLAVLAALTAACAVLVAAAIGIFLAAIFLGTRTVTPDESEMPSLFWPPYCDSKGLLGGPFFFYNLISLDFLGCFGYDSRTRTLRVFYCSIRPALVAQGRVTTKIY